MPQSAAEHPFERHDHVVFETDEGWQVRFNDARRFGLMLLVADEAVPQAQAVQGLGARAARRDLRRRRAGRRVSRDDERPSRRPCSIRRHWSASAISMPARRCSWPASRRAARPTPCRASAPTGWSAAIKQVLLRSIDDGGSTLRDHVQPGGELGYFQTRFNVYDRAGALCPTRDCGKLVQAVWCSPAARPSIARTASAS